MIDIFKWFSSDERKARRLFRDVVTIIESDRLHRSDDNLEKTAALITEDLQIVRERVAARPRDKAVIRYDLERRHKEFARRRQHNELTAITLVIIQLRAEKLGPSGQPIIATIDEFVASPTRNGS